MNEDKGGRAERLKAARAQLLRQRLASQGVHTAPVPRLPAGAPRLASSAQARLYFLCQLNPGSPAYHMHKTWCIRGPVDAGALERAVQILAGRHESLRSVFSLHEGQLLQTVQEPFNWQLERTRLEPEEDVTEQAVQAFAVAFINRPFDLHNGPLFRMALLEHGEDTRWLVLSIHHLVADEWSLQILLRELHQCYGALLSGRAAGLTELPLQYVDYAAWQKTQLERIRQAELPFWLEQFALLPDALELPFDFSRPRRLSASGRFEQLCLDEGTAGQVVRSAKQHGATPFMVLMAAFMALLQRYTGQSDIVIGTPAANRARPEFEKLIGLFLNTVVVRAQVDDEQSFAELLATVRGRALAAYAHQSLPFEELVAALNVEREPNRNPLFQVMLVNEEVGDAPEPPAGQSWEPLGLDTGTSKFDLTLFVRLTDERLQLAMEYSTDLFDACSITAMLEAYARLLRSLVASPSAPLAAAELLPENQRRALLSSGRGEALQSPLIPVPEQLAQHAHSNDMALVMGDERLSYLELDRAVGQLAGSLAAGGVRPGDCVPLLLPTGTALVVAMLACWRLNAAYVPIDPDYPAARAAAMLAELARSGQAAGVAVTNTSLAARLPETFKPLLAERRHAHTLPLADAQPTAADAPAYLIYTSGSTGAPKGVLISHGALAASNAARQHWYERAPQRYLLLSSCAFDSSVAGLFWTLTSGGTLVLCTPEQRRDTRAVVSLIEQHGISHTLMLPSLWSLTLDTATANQLDSLTDVIVAGEACPEDLPAKHFARLPAVALYNEYGPTEAAVWATAHRFEPGSEAMYGQLPPIGRPIPGAVARVLDRRRRLVPRGVSGELYLGGAGLADGYLGQAELTGNRFVADPFDAAQRLYRSGDRVRQNAAGQLLFLGRTDQQIKLRGHRIEPAEIEARIRCMPGVDEAHVGLDPGSRHPRLLAWVTPLSVQPEIVRAALQEQLPAYMVPTAVVPLAEWPTGANGKLDRHALPPPPAVSGPGTVRELDSALEPLAEIWQQILGVAVNDPAADFFALGGNSLNGVSMILEVERRLGTRLPLAALFESPTLAGLHRRMETPPARDNSAVITLRDSGSLAPLFCIQSQARSMLDHLPEQQPVYLVYETLKPGADGELTVGTLAGRYLREITTHRPDGRCRLMGFSVGALVAMEMAHGLRDDARQVELLILCDPPLTDAGLFYRQRARLLRQQLADSRGMFGRFRVLAGQAAQSITLRIKRFYLRLQGLYFDLTDKSRVAAVLLLRKRFSQPATLLSFRQNQRYRALYNAYQPKSYEGDTLVLLPESERVNLEETSRHWAQYLTGRHRVVLVKGARDHLDFLQDHCMAQIAAQLRAWPDTAGPEAGQPPKGNTGANTASSA